MELPLVLATDCEVHAVIRFLTAKNKNVTEIHRKLCSVYGDDVMSRPMVHRWRQSFIDGRTMTHDEQRSGRPSTSRVASIAEDVRRVIDNDRCLTLDDNLAELPPNVELHFIK